MMNPSADPRAALSDEALMERLRGGDDLALNQLMERWERPLAAFTMRYTNNNTDAIELAQETFVRVYENRRRYRSKAKFSPWLFAIAANLCRNHARWSARHPTVSLDARGRADGTIWADSLESPSPPPDTVAELTETATQVRDAIQSLPHDQRTAIFLTEFENLSHAEVGRAVGCSAKAVETRLYRARQTLRKRLGRLLAPEK